MSVRGIGVRFAAFSGLDDLVPLYGLYAVLFADTGWEPRTRFAEGLAAQWKWAADRVATR